MKFSQKLRFMVFAAAAWAVFAGALAVLSSSDAGAKPCCRVMVCSQTPPYACYEKCVTCPTFP